MNLLITKATDLHLRQLKATGAFPDCQEHMLEATFLDHGAAFAIVDGVGVALCAGGVLPVWKGVGLLWLAMDEKMRTKPRILIYGCKDIIAKIHEAGHFHRLQMYIDSDNRRDINFADLLGFTFEGTLHKHKADGRDHLMFAKTY